MAALDRTSTSSSPGPRTRASAQYTLPSAGLLTPDKQYYWRVRAKNEKGVWGPWSKTWSFTPRGPGYPLDVTLDFDRDKGVGTLKWKPNPVGRRPAKYRVYGSDEKGFSVSDVPYEVNVGISKELPSRFPANFIAETDGDGTAGLGQRGRLCPQPTRPTTAWWRWMSRASGAGLRTMPPRPAR